MKKRICTLLLSILMLAALVGTASAAEQKSFVLTVATANSMVIEPERIPYTDGQTIKEALLASDHSFTQLEEQNYIGAVDDVAGNYVILYDGGGYSVDAPASSITAMRIGVTNVEKEHYDDMLSLVRRMAEYRDMENHVQNYPDAQEAYKTCLNALRGDGSAAAAGQEKLDKAIADYAAILNGPKYAVSIKATQGGVMVTNLVFTLTDVYGNVTTGVGSTLSVIAGDYTFSVSDGGYNRTEGTLKVQSSLNDVPIELPTGEWFDEIYFRTYSSWTDYSAPYRSEQDTANHRLTVWVDDTACDQYGMNIVAYQGPDIPDVNKTLLRSIYTSVKGVDMSGKHITWSSKSSDTVWGTFLTDIVAEGLEGRVFPLEARYVNEAGHTMIQSYEVDVRRAPTLTMLKVYADGVRLRIGAEAYSIGLDGSVTGALPVDKYFKHAWEYNATTTANVLEISATGFSGDYTITGVGGIPVTSDAFDHKITVTAPNGMESVYTIHVNKTRGVTVKLDLPDADTTGQVFTDMDSEVQPMADGTYRLVEGQEYYYLGTKNTYYHTKETFTAQAGLVVDVAAPVAEDWLTNFQIYSGRRNALGDDGEYHGQWIAYDADKPFSAAAHEYTYYTATSDSKVYLQADTSKGTAVAHTLSQSWVRPYPMTLTITRPVDADASYGSADEVLRFMEAVGYSVPMTIQVEQAGEGGVMYYQEYKILFARRLEMYDLTAASGEMPVVFETIDGEGTEFDRDVKDYILTVDRDADELTLRGQFDSGDTYPDDEYQGGFHVLINGQRYEEEIEYQGQGAYRYAYLPDVTIPLARDKDEEKVTIEVCHVDPTSIPATYTLTVRKSDPVPVTVKADPSDLLVFMTSDLTGRHEYDDNGTFMLTPGRTYTYNATRVGYVGVTGSYTVPAEGGTLQLTLQKAAENTSLVDLPSEWPHLRLDNDNSGVIDAPTPISSDDAVLYWATKIGDGFDQDACSPPIIVNGDLYVYSGETLYRVDKTTGQVLATGKMCGKSSFGINPPTYANGMIFVGLSMGRVQAFNANTLESLWIYTDSLGGQPNCPIVYHDGYIYTGFWSGEDKVCNYVCLTATDEDPTNTLESKLASWTYSSVGGFYWSGAYVCDDFTLIGTDDGEVGYTKGYARLVSLETRTGKPISEVKMDVTGDIRSSITHYNGKYYFTSKGGYFFEASVDDSGAIRKVNKLELKNYASSASNPAMSTSTPTIYNGRAYIGVSGTGQFTQYSGHNITVIDIPNWEIAYKVRTQGYPQTSGVLTTAYKADEGAVYVYFFDNYTPGKLRVLKDAPGKVSTDLTSTEYSFETALNLFEPRGDQAQYAICSPVVDSDGTIYFKNDSAYLMAVGSTVDHLEIVKQPDKTEYKAGETFDATGMQIMAHFTNGVTKDVTQYMTWSEEPLTAEDTDFQLEYPIVMYQNKNGAEGEYPKPIATVKLIIKSDIMCGDVDGDGKITVTDAMYIFQYLGQRRELDNDALKAADTDKDGKITVTDAMYIFQYLGQRRELN